MTKEYIGDSVYVDIVDGMIALTTENGFGATNTIFLEPCGYAKLLEYVTRAIAGNTAKEEPNG